MKKDFKVDQHLFSFSLDDTSNDLFANIVCASSNNIVVVRTHFGMMIHFLFAKLANILHEHFELLDSLLRI